MNNTGGNIERGYIVRRGLTRPSFFDLLKKITVPELLNHLGVLDGHKTVNIRGIKQFMIRCPFHKEKTPSCGIHTRDKYFYCWGCHAKGDMLQFVVQIQGRGYLKAIQTIRELFRIKGLKYENIKVPVAEVLEDAKNAVSYIISSWAEKQNNKTYYEEIKKYLPGGRYWEDSYLQDFLIHNKLQELYAISQIGKIKDYEGQTILREFLDYVDSRRSGESYDDFMGEAHEVNYNEIVNNSSH